MLMSFDRKEKEMLSMKSELNKNKWLKAKMNDRMEKTNVKSKTNGRIERRIINGRIRKQIVE